MRKSTDGKKLAAVASALAVAGTVLLLVLAALSGLLDTDGADVLAAAVLGLYALLGLAVAAGVLAALRERLREIQRGEEEDARRY